jgi:hypothetical protein
LLAVIGLSCDSAEDRCYASRVTAYDAWAAYVLVIEVDARAADSAATEGWARELARTNEACRAALRAYSAAAPAPSSAFDLTTRRLLEQAAEESVACTALQFAAESWVEDYPALRPLVNETARAWRDYLDATLPLGERRHWTQRQLEAATSAREGPRSGIRGARCVRRARG